MSSSLTQMCVAQWYPWAQSESFHITFLPETMIPLLFPPDPLFPLCCLDISAAIFLLCLIFFFNPYNIKHMFAEFLFLLIVKRRGTLYIFL